MREFRIAGAVVAGILTAVLGTIALCAIGGAIYAEKRSADCYAAGRRDGVQVRYDSAGCTTRGVFGIRVPVDY